MKLAIYGAQGYALSAYEAITTLYPKREISCFLVTRMDGNAAALAGLPVREIAAFAEELAEAQKQEVEILIATPENVQAEIEETLEQYGFQNRSRLTSSRHAELAKLFHAREGRLLPLSALPVGCREPFIRVYMAKSHVDKPLHGAYMPAPYVFPIQVGAACCDIRIAGLADNTGENISDKNGNYCELTALYWIWRNVLTAPNPENGMKERYYGLCQYRRILALQQDDLLRLVNNDVDVVLPYPLPYEPDIHAHHERYLKEADWQVLVDVLRELQPAYAEALPEILGQRYLYNYNVILAKRSVLRDYCAWLFPILAKVEERSVPKGSERRDRYIGYMGETLETLYFMKNDKLLNVAHTECRLLV